MDETHAPQDTPLEVQQQPVVDAETKSLVTRHDAAAPAPPAGGPMSRCRATTKAGRPCSNGGGPTGYCIAHAKDPQTLATLQAARSAGGRAPRVNLQVGLPPAVAEAIDLRDSAGQLAILTATTRALAMGRVSSNTAQAIAVLVKTAAGINAADQSEAIKALEERLENLVVNVSPRAGGRRWLRSVGSQAPPSSSSTSASTASLATGPASR